MQNIDYEKFYNEFDVGDFLLQPIGKFGGDDLKLIYATINGTKDIATMSIIYGVRGALSKEIEKIKNTKEWREKAHYTTEKEAFEIFCRIWFMDFLKRNYSSAE